MSEELKNKEFDKNVQNKFSEHKAPVPQYLWTNINNEAALLETASLRKRVVWYRWLVAGLVVLLGGLILFYQLEDKYSKNAQISEANIDKEVIAAEEEIELTENLSLTENKTALTNEYVLTDETDDVKLRETEQIEELSPRDNRQQDNLEEPIIGESLKKAELTVPAENIVKSSLKSGLIKSEIDASKNILKASVEEQEFRGNEELASGVEEGEQKEEVELDEIVANELSNSKKELVYETEQIVDKKKNEVIQDLSSRKENVQEENNAVAEEGKQIDVKKELIVKENESDSTITDSTATAKTPSNIPMVTEAAEGKTLSRLTATLFVLPNFSKLGFEAGSNTHEIYKTNEVSKMRLSYGANVGYLISEKVMVKLGVSYHQAKTEIELTDVRPKELPILMDPNNNSITVYSSMGTVNINDIGSFSFAGDDDDDVDLDDEDDFASLNFKEKQEFLLIDIPLTVGYSIGKGKLKLLLEGGMVASILTKSESKIEISNVHSSDATVGIENYHQMKTILLGSTVGLGFKYPLSKRFSIVELSSYNVSFTDLNKDNSSKIKPNSINFSLGLQFRF